MNQYQTYYNYFTNGWLKQALGQKWNSGTWSTVTEVDFNYDAAGNCTARNNGINGTADVQTAYTYNARSETMGISHGSLYDLTYLRDGAGNPTQIAYSGSQFNQPYTGANAVQYSYDAASELTNQNWGYWTGSNWTAAYSTAWTYDWVGNRNPTSNTYNQVDELNAGNGYTYDSLGNVTAAPGSVGYTYTSDNLLWTCNQGASLTWDADRQRAELTSGSNTWDCLYDPTADTPAVLLAVNTVNSATTYMFNMRQPSGELLASFDASSGPNKYYYHFDDLGSTLLITNGGGSPSDSFTYDAWGSVLASTNSSKPYQYVGQLGYYTPGSSQGMGNILQLGVRFYDPSTGRFTQRDPVTKPGSSKYAYGPDTPTDYVDPTGLMGNVPAPIHPHKATKDEKFADCMIKALGRNLAIQLTGCAIGCGIASAVFAETTWVPCFAACSGFTLSWGLLGTAIGAIPTIIDCRNEVYGCH